MKTSSLALCRIALAALFLLGAMPAHAIPILVSSTFNSTNREVRSIIYGKRLTPEPGATIGAFDFSFSYDAKVLQLNQVLFAPLLGSPDKRTYIRNADTLIPASFGSGEALSFASLTSPDTVRLSDISLLEASADTCSFCTGPYLDNLQRGWVPLVSLTFHGLVPILNVNPDTMGFHLSVLSTSDGHGNPFQSSPTRYSSRRCRCRRHWPCSASACSACYAGAPPAREGKVASSKTGRWSTCAMPAGLPC